MNILQEIDATLHYENIEKAWHKYKFIFVLGLVALFAGIAGLNKYNKDVMVNSKADSEVIIAVLNEKANSANPIDVIIASEDELVTTQAKEALSLELAKEYKLAKNTAEMEKVLIELTSAKTKAVKNMANYMLAEFYLSTDATKAIEFVDNSNISKKAFTYSMMQEIKAMALSSTGETAKAAGIYTTLLIKSNTPADMKKRVSMKLGQIAPEQLATVDTTAKTEDTQTAQDKIKNLISNLF